MYTCARILCAVVVLGGAAAFNANVSGQSASPIGGAPFTHVGVVVRDIEQATKAFVEVMGSQPAAIRTVPIVLPDNTKVEIRSASFQLPNVQVEFAQPVTTSGPIYEHLQKIGQGIHHLGFAVTDGIDEKRAYLEQKGGKWTAGAKGGNYVFVDFKPILGMTIELVQTSYPPASAPKPIPAADPAPLSLRSLAHVGIAVDDTDKVAQAFSDIFGLPAPRVRDYKDNQYPPGHTWSTEAYIRLTTAKLANIGVELLGAVGKPNPWSEYVDRFKGSTVQHLAMSIGPRLPETVAELRKKGGRWTNGKEGGSYAYVDFVDSFGIALEIVGSVPSTAPPAQKP